MPECRNRGTKPALTWKTGNSLKKGRKGSREGWSKTQRKGAWTLK